MESNYQNIPYDPNGNDTNTNLGVNFHPASNVNHPMGGNQALPNQDFLIQNDFFREGNFQAYYINDYQTALRNAKSAFIKQKVELLEVLTGCETKNRYSVYLRFDNGMNALLFKCKEESGWCVRNCLQSSARPFEMKVKFIKNSIEYGNDDYSAPNIVFERPFKCTCWCLARPEMIGMNRSLNQQIGRVVEPFTCCDPTFSLTNAAGQEKYKITASCCQCGLICNRCCEVRFNIYSTFTGLPMVPENAVGSIVKKFSGFVQEMFTDADNFDVIFPGDATPEDKLMLIGTTLMIDYRYFEDKGRNDKTRKKGLLFDF